MSIQKFKKFISDITKRNIELFFDLDFWERLNSLSNKKIKEEILDFLWQNKKSAFYINKNLLLEDFIRIYNTSSDVLRENVDIQNIINQIIQQKNNPYIIFAVNKLYKCEPYLNLNQNIEALWDIFFNCNTLTSKSINTKKLSLYWNNLLKDFKDIFFKWIIIQEPFLVDDKVQNINALLDIFKFEKCYILTRDENKKNIDNSIFPKKCEIIFYKEADVGHKKIHDRFILTNYFIFVSGNSFDYFNSKTKEVNFFTFLLVSSVINNFNFFKNTLTNLFETIKN